MSLFSKLKDRLNEFEMIIESFYRKQQLFNASLILFIKTLANHFNKCNYLIHSSDKLRYDNWLSHFQQVNRFVAQTLTHKTMVLI